MRERGFDDWVLYWIQRRNDRNGGDGAETSSSGREIAAFLHDLALILLSFLGVIAVLRLVAVVLGA